MGIQHQFFFQVFQSEVRGVGFDQNTGTSWVLSQRPSSGSMGCPPVSWVRGRRRAWGEKLSAKRCAFCAFYWAVKGSFTPCWLACLLEQILGIKGAQFLNIKASSFLLKFRGKRHSALASVIQLSDWKFSACSAWLILKHNNGWAVRFEL
jgi:hypothetical protein